MKIERDFIMNGERYDFDWGKCSPGNGYAQVDTSQDAPYFGTWTNPFEFTTVQYCEGDVTTYIAENQKEYIKYLRDLKNAYEVGNMKFIGIDPMLNQKLIDRFDALGLGDLLH